MDFNLDIRKKQLQSLKQYVKSSEDNVKAIFQTLGWTVQKTLETDDDKVVCPINKNHLISHKTCQQHLELCKLKSEGYDEKESFLSEPLDATEYNIKIPDAKKIEIFSATRASKNEFKSAWNGRDSDPLTSDRIASTFSVDERLALYDYSIKHTKAPRKPAEFTLDLVDTQGKKEVSDKERLLMQRDAKRRKIKYKSVHTSKKSQTEIMREVINNQMGLYTDWIKQKQEQEKREKERLRRLAKDKTKKHSSKNSDVTFDTNHYQYSGTSYDQACADQNAIQWDQSLPYSEAYNSQYYGSVQTSQGVITDWSHLYQGLDADFTMNPGSYQQEGEYLEPSTSAHSTNEVYTNTLEVMTDSFYSHLNNESQGENDKANTCLKITPRKDQSHKYVKSK